MASTDTLGRQSRRSRRGDRRAAECVRDNKGRREAAATPADVRGIGPRVSRRGGGMQRSGAGRGRRPLLPRRRSLLPAPRASPPRATDTSVVRAAQGRHLNRTQRSMLQQMSSSLSAQVGEVTTIARPFEGRFSVDVSSEASSDAAEESELPQCKIRRNYNCAKCTYNTQNPRAYLVHTRDVHFGRFRIYECQHCIYASRHQQKLLRHTKMVHGASASSSTAKVENEAAVNESAAAENMERMEDLLEEIEECDDSQMEMDVDDQPERADDAELYAARNATSGMPKGKGKFFSCDKCNYVTHIKARYTKHVKYHSMPMIKCTMCDFRTPYKWNLDRHMKNHGGSGSFVCSKCTFTADIKQSLTVHEMNHHTPPVGQSAASRRRNRVGASDLTSAESTSARPKEEEGSGDSHSSHSVSDIMGLQYERDIVSCNSDSNDAVSSQLSQNGEDSQSVQDTPGQHSPSSGNEDKAHKQNKKAPRPIPQLIPLNASTPNQSKTGEPPAKKFKESSDLTSKFGNLPDDITLIPVNNTPKETTVRKKNESFFDKLKERLLTETGEEGSLKCKSCGFESKCLSEHSVHEKNCAAQASRVMMNTSHSSMGSTRCQNCRHRCKSSADLFVHMRTCGKKEDTHNATETKQDNNEASTSSYDKDAEPHPMENVVFVWNNINQGNKFERPLDININDDSTMPESHRNYDTEIVDENEGMTLSPNSLSLGKNVYKCPDCKFWAATASRFHVHIVGHLNKKPFECSLCKYKSNWRWDITKHIKLKSARDPEHNDAKVLMTDETGRRNYSKYNKFLAVPVVNENGENEFHYIDQNTSVDATMELDEPLNETGEMMNTSYEMQPLNLQTQFSDLKYSPIDTANQVMKPKKTLWKCKKCNYKDPSKEALLEHVRQHSKDILPEEPHTKKPDVPDPADLAYRCGHCNQLSNWKHVIQRHCRLKHDGIIKVITTVKPKPDPVPPTNTETFNDFCTRCPFRTNDKKLLVEHLQQHQPSSQSIFKCYFCPYFVKDEQDLIQHLLLHGITDPEDYISKAMGCRSPLPEHAVMHDNIVTPGSSNINKRHKCQECPYETNSKSQFMYHEQFHRTSSTETPYKCPECNYRVSKRHLLQQHLRVHGIFARKNETEAELEASTSNQKDKSDSFSEEIPYVWVSARNEFHKMYKCRYCSYVNSQKCKIPNHEKIHCLGFENSEVIIYKCLECKFTCDNAGRLAEHSKKHGLLYGRIYSIVDEDIPDEDQITKLRRVVELEKSAMSEDSAADENTFCDPKEIKILYFCQKCPARYFTESELKAHEKFHDLSNPNKCKHCEFSVPEEADLVTHMSVHSDEHHIRTNMLKFIHNSHSLYKEPRLDANRNPDSNDVSWSVAVNYKSFENTEPQYKKTQETKHTPKQYCCKECPAKFFKSSALTYHMGLHGGEGEHKCKKCSYSVKNVGNLAKHEVLHENENKSANCEYESGDDLDFKNIPLSGTDLFQRKTEAQKRVLTDKDKLVKPNDHFPPVLQADPQFGYLMHGNPEFIYPTYLKNGRQKEKRYKCHKCPSAFEKREQYKIHLSLHGSKQRYKCELCDYSVKYYANYVQHMRKHQMNDEAQAERTKGAGGEVETQEVKAEESTDNIKLAIKTMPKGTPKTDFQQFSIRDQQTLRLLQLRRSMNNGGKEANTTETSPVKERKLHMCLLCPYTNQRQDALSNHYRRHDDTDVLNCGSHKCSYCDLVVVQSHFLREHLKTHFNFNKIFTPECFVANDDVSFTISKLDEESEPVDLKMDMKNKILSCNDEKIFVKIKTGELVVE